MIVEDTVTSTVSKLGAELITKLIKKAFETSPPQVPPAIEKNSDTIAQEAVSTEPNTTIRPTTSRFQQVWKLLFDNEYTPRYSVIDIACDLQMAGLEIDKESVLDSYLSGREELPISFLRTFATQYHVNFDWLISGKGTPFPLNSGRLLPSSYRSVKEIMKERPYKYLYLVRSRTREGQAMIILQHGQWDYTVISKRFGIGRNDDGLEDQQIESFYRLSKELYSSRPSPQSVTVNKSLFSKLFYGEIFPGIISENHKPGIDYNHWAKDFLDYEHKFKIAEHYALWYGEEFVEAQEALRYLL